MCNTKAEGGVRCNGHVVGACSAAMDSYASAATGVDRATVKALSADLRRQYVGAPAPERDEVDDFLMQQQFRVRHEERLPEKRKRSVLRRLRDAVGVARPDGPTFQSWKHVLGRAAHYGKRVAAGVVIAGFVGGMGTMVVAAGQDNAAYNAARHDNLGTAISQKYGGRVVSVDGDYSTRHYNEFTVDGKTEECRTDWEPNKKDNALIEDVTLYCLDDAKGPEARFSPEASGRVDMAAQTPTPPNAMARAWTKLTD